MYFLKRGSPAQLQCLRIFEPLMISTGIVQPRPTTSLALQARIVSQ